MQSESSHEKGSDSNLSSSSQGSTTWENCTTTEQQVDSSTKRVSSIGGGMKRVASGMSMNSLQNMGNEVHSSMKRVSSIGNGLKRVASGMSVNSLHIMGNAVDSSIKRISSIGGGMKRAASGMSTNSLHSSSELDSSMKKVGSMGSMKRVASGNSINDIRRVLSAGNALSSLDVDPPTKIDILDSDHPQNQTIEVNTQDFEQEPIKESMATLLNSGYCGALHRSLHRDYS